MLHYRRLNPKDRIHRRHFAAAGHKLSIWYIMSYQPWRHRSFKANKQDEELPQLKSLNKLSLADLLKIKRSYEAYFAKKEEIGAENSKNDLINNRIEQENKINEQINNKNRQNFDKHYYTPSLELTWAIERKLEKLQVGLVSGLWTKTIQYVDQYGKYENAKFRKTSETETLIAQHKQAMEKLITLEDKTKYISIQRLINKLHEPKGYTVLVIGGSQVKVCFEYINLGDLNHLIDSHCSEIEKRKEAIHEIKARAANNELETRKLAEPFRRNINKQLCILDSCPYCADPLSLNNAHLDHIYPVSKGGLSRPKNLVFVCSSCNRKKSDSTLRHFIEEQGFRAIAVHERLKTLFKEF